MPQAVQLSSFPLTRITRNTVNNAHCEPQYGMEVPYDLNSYVRVLKMASTPSREEFLQISKISGAGILLIGLVGFIVFAIMSIAPGVGV